MQDWRIGCNLPFSPSDWKLNSDYCEAMNKQVIIFSSLIYLFIHLFVLGSRSEPRRIKINLSEYYFPQILQKNQIGSVKKNQCRLNKWKILIQKMRRCSLFLFKLQLGVMKKPTLNNKPYRSTSNSWIIRPNSFVTSKFKWTLDNIRIEKIISAPIWAC